MFCVAMVKPPVSYLKATVLLSRCEDMRLGTLASIGDLCYIRTKSEGEDEDGEWSKTRSNS
jgi:hypothetical protein